MTRLGVRYAVTSNGLMENAVITIEGSQIVAIDTGEADVALENVVLIPGLVNTHSHSFQRVIRGRTEFLDREHPEDSFWSWRTRMYGAAAQLTPQCVEQIAAMTFMEMQLSGITSVGEFHYLHHQPDGQPYEEPNAIGNRIVSAAKRTGMRIALLRVAYERAGFGHRSRSDQKRFVEPDIALYLERTNALAEQHAADPLVSVGFAPHSIRAVSRAWLEAIAHAATASGRIIHIHACEQRREIEESKAEHGVGPIPLLHEIGLLGPHCTVVHATHIDDVDRHILAQTGTTVCACPTTEQNLGDGFVGGKALVEHAIPIALGSDSHAEIDLWAEARSLEYQERLLHERRNVLAQAVGDGTRYETASTLWPMLNENGARALGLQRVGAVEVGQEADIVCLDLNDPALVGFDDEIFLSQLLFATTPRAIKHVFIAGRQTVRDGRHMNQEMIIDDFRKVMSTLTN